MFANATKNVRVYRGSGLRAVTRARGDLHIVTPSDLWLLDGSSHSYSSPLIGGRALRDSAIKGLLRRPSHFNANTLPTKPFLYYVVMGTPHCKQYLKLEVRKRFPIFSCVFRNKIRCLYNVLFLRITLLF